MTSTAGFNIHGRLVQHKLGTRTRAERGRLNTSSFCPRYDKGCSSRRVATVSCVAAPTTGVSVDSHNTMSRTTTPRLQYNLSDPHTRTSFLDSRRDSRFYKVEVEGGI